MEPTSLPDDAARRVGALLDRLDAALPDVVAGLHVIGSIGLGDYEPGHSDIDVVVVTRQPVGGKEVSTIDEVHRSEAEAAGSTPIQASYLTTSSLVTSPDPVVPIVSHLEGETTFGPAFDVNPVTWRQLVRHAVAVRGNPTSKWMRDPSHDKLAQWCRENLSEYWQPLVQRFLDADVSQTSSSAAGSTAAQLEWLALGPARLDHTIETGEIISKSVAGTRMLDRVEPEERPLFEAALAVRRGEVAADTPVELTHLATVARAIDRTILTPHRTP